MEGADWLAGRVVGTLINAGAIVVGGALGLVLSREPAQRHQVWLKTLLGVLSLFVGFRMVWSNLNGSLGRVTLHLVVALVALVLGNLLGKGLRLQRGANRLGRYAGDRFRRAQTSGRREFSEGFVTCTILFCVGPLAILGSLQDGLQGDPRTLALKGAMDGLATFAFVRVFGAGAMLSALPVLAYQGTLTLLAGLMRPVVDSPAVLEALGVSGGLLVAMTALTIFEIRKVPLADYLPGLVLAPLIWWWLG